jgi:3-hydroxyacyl-[acyl-carrier-protein] dehydratase
MELPHKDPIKFIDNFDLLPDGTVSASYTIPLNHPVFQGHFPHISVWPGVHLIEGMNQTAGLHALNLAKKISNTDIDPTKIITFVTSVDKVKFRQPCFPGDQLRYTAELVRERSGHLFYECVVYKDSRRISSATIGLTAKKL